ncbi:hypothetical protein [Nannocystis sp.]|uniref:hypothetical protein n=1 Tax=Nannocystis sp. TaxID=1962667 RepID=UPI0025D9FD6F|nr:hypothetical protein [Nannocystis sp.]MBK7828807.1 hypothetical protein [Nannocystis sp.]
MCIATTLRRDWPSCASVRATVKPRHRSPRSNAMPTAVRSHDLERILRERDIPRNLQTWSG